MRWVLVGATENAITYALLTGGNGLKMATISVAQFVKQHLVA